jgi:hypothetical protein
VHAGVLDIAITLLEAVLVLVSIHRAGVEGLGLISTGAGAWDEGLRCSGWRGGDIRMLFKTDFS